MSASNCLRVNCAEETELYRKAVSRILAALQVERGVTLVDIAEEISVSLGTISNAANKRNDLGATYLKRIGQAYGAHTLDPYLALFGARGVPLQSENVRDILPLIARAGLKVAEARDRDSPGGEREIHTERLGYLPTLKELQRELESVICEIEKLAA